MNKTILATLISAALCSTALASDRSEHPYAAEPDATVEKVQFDWSGYYLGVGGRYTKVEDTDTLFPGFISSVTKYNVSAFAGVNYHHLKDFVIGLEGDFTRMDADFTTAPIPVTANDIFSIRARFGVPTDRALWYVSAGGSYTSVTATYPFGIGNVDLTGYGAVIGFGVDYAITDNVIAGVEFQRHFFKKFGKNDIPAAFAGLQVIDADVNLVSLKLAYKF